MEIPKDGADNAQDDLEIQRLHRWLAGGIHKVLQLRDKQLADADEQRVLERRNVPIRNWSKSNTWQACCPDAQTDLVIA